MYYRMNGREGDPSQPENDPPKKNDEPTEFDKTFTGINERDYEQEAQDYKGYLEKGPEQEEEELQFPADASNGLSYSKMMFEVGRQHPREEVVNPGNIPSPY